MEEGIQKTVNEVPPEKVINAVPFYTRIWKSEGANLTSEAVGMELAEEFVDNHNIADASVSFPAVPATACHARLILYGLEMLVNSGFTKAD